MKRKDARKIAVCLLYSNAFCKEDIEDSLNAFFSEEHFNTLSEENDLFSEYPDDKQKEYIYSVITKTCERQSEIEELICENLSGWKMERISKTALATLKCAVCEMLYLDDIPVSVSINEAVEIAKDYDNTDTVSFINGVLGSIAKSLPARNSDE